MKRLDLTDDQHTTLLNILRDRIEQRGADRGQLVAERASRDMLSMCDLAITSLSELYVACSVVVDVAAIDRTMSEMTASIDRTLERLRRAGGDPADIEEMLQRSLGVGPVDADDEAALHHALAIAANCEPPRLVVGVDDSGATGTLRSDWGERGEGSETP